MIAGIGIMGHPAEWPELDSEFRIARFLQHSRWASDLYRPVFGSRCIEWPVGIDTEQWSPSTTPKGNKPVLIYRKFLHDRERLDRELLGPIIRELARRHLDFRVISYGAYQPEEYLSALRHSCAMVFLSAHESQGIAYQEAMSCNVPILAWNPGFSMDPDRFRLGTPVIPATSVPYFSDECGNTFLDEQDFGAALDDLLARDAKRRLAPRAFVERELSLSRSNEILLKIMHEAMEA